MIDEKLKFEIEEEMIDTNDELYHMRLRPFERMVEIHSVDEETKKLEVIENGMIKSYLLEEEGKIILGEKAIICIKEMNGEYYVSNINYIIVEKVLPSVIINNVNGATIEVIDNEIYKYYELRCDSPIISGAFAIVTITQKLDDVEHVSAINYHTTVEEVIFLGMVTDDSIEVSINGEYKSYLLDSNSKKRNLVWELGIGAKVQLQSIKTRNGQVVSNIVVL